jgi:hypothetical protein
MSILIRLASILSLVCILTIGWHHVCAAADTAPATQPAGSVRIGIYDSRAVCIASRGSPIFMAPIRDLQKQLADAQAAGDGKKVEQIKKRGETLQMLRHLQGFSNARVDDLMVQIKDQLPQIAQAAGVVAIVDAADFHSSDVQIVDVTDELVKAFHPDEKTLKTVADLRKVKPIEIVDALGMHH